MGDAHANGSDPDAVIPPPPAAAPVDHSSSVPLAPPLSGPPAPPASQPPAPGGPVAPPAPPLPPYAAAPQPGQRPPQQPVQYPPVQQGLYPPPRPGQYPAGQQPSAPYGGTYPYPSAPPVTRPRSGSTLGIVIAAVAVFVLIIAIGVGVAVSLLVASRSETATAPPATSITEEPDAPSAPPQTDPESDDSGDADASGIADVLQAKIDEYKRLRESGALWESIPDTEFNRTAVSAFLYFLTDMKVATIWGVDEAQAQEYEDRMTMLEERLLAEQPLGDDIQITLEDEVFTYDGETGEGGYTPR